MNGFLLIDKPTGITSFAVVSRVKRLLNVSKVGHCGTLDPLATGLLIVCLGKATKLAQFISGQDKCYETEMMFGSTSDTFDRDGVISPIEFGGTVTLESFKTSVAAFMGEIVQTAPEFSALKHKGKPRYYYARKNEKIEPKSRKILIRSIEIVNFEYPLATLKITCSTGTYIRSLVHDIGNVLGCGAYVNQLRRTSIGSKDVENASTLDALENIVENGIGSAEPLASRVEQLPCYVSMDAMIELPNIQIAEERSREIVNGVPIRQQDILSSDLPLHAGSLVAMRNSAGELLAIGKSIVDSGGVVETGKILEYVRVI